MTRRVEHIITGLGIGGAELMLSHLARGGTRFEHSVTALSATSRIAKDLVAEGVAVTHLGMKKNLMVPTNTLQLSNRLKKRPPQLVQTWLYHADLVGGLAARRAGVPVVWNLRQTDVGPRGQKFTTSLVVRLCALLSRSIPVKIVCGSNAAREAHRKMGFDERRMEVISNGVDTGEFKPDPPARAWVRRELGLNDDTPLVGRVGRYHPQKDYRCFVEAARVISDAVPEAHFLLVGEHVDWRNSELVAWIEQSGLNTRFHLLGARRDIPELMAALDVFVSSSVYGEGFPNVIAEAMACEVPCVATDTGDSAEIIGRADRIVPPGDPQRLAQATIEVLSGEPAMRRREGAQGRQRVTARFALDAMINSYETLYEQVMSAGNQKVAGGAGV